MPPSWPPAPPDTTTPGTATAATTTAATATAITTTAATATAEPGSAPKTRSVDATWEGGYRCRVAAGRFELQIDEPVSAGGDDTGPQPTDVFLASIASCFALAVAHVARKRSVELPDLSVRAIGEYDGPRFAKVRVEVTSSHPRDELERLVERAKGVCYVSNTIRTLQDTDVVVMPARA